MWAAIAAIFGMVDMRSKPRPVCGQQMTEIRGGLLLNRKIGSEVDCPDGLDTGLVAVSIVIFYLTVCISLLLYDWKALRLVASCETRTLSSLIDEGSSTIRASRQQSRLTSSVILPRRDLVTHTLGLMTHHYGFRQYVLLVMLLVHRHLFQIR